MFTGIVEGLCKVEKIQKKSDSMVVSVNLGDLSNDVKNGDSIAINGTCLTVTDIKDQVATFDVLTETITRTSLKDVKPTIKVNVERALRVGDRMGGHFVTGHVDGTGVIEKKTTQPGQTDLWVKIGKDLGSMMIEKGSIAIDGISLTLVDITDSAFSVALIPFTLAETTLGFKGAGDIVNLELDMIGKWVKRLIPTEYSKPSSITLDKLKDQGFA